MEQNRKPAQPHRQLCIHRARRRGAGGRLPADGPARPPGGGGGAHAPAAGDAHALWPAGACAAGGSAALRRRGSGGGGRLPARAGRGGRRLHADAFAGAGARGGVHARLCGGGGAGCGRQRDRGGAAGARGAGAGGAGRGDGAVCSTPCCAPTTAPGSCRRRCGRAGARRMPPCRRERRPRTRTGRFPSRPIRPGAGRACAAPCSQSSGVFHSFSFFCSFFSFRKRKERTKEKKPYREGE